MKNVPSQPDDGTPQDTPLIEGGFLELCFGGENFSGGHGDTPAIQALRRSAEILRRLGKESTDSPPDHVTTGIRLAAQVAHELVELIELGVEEELKGKGKLK